MKKNHIVTPSLKRAHDKRAHGEKPYLVCQSINGENRPLVIDENFPSFERNLMDYTPRFVC